jgi:RHS repeat-associated protein
LPDRPAFAFQGHPFDPVTGWHYFRLRYYDPTLGRFVQQDPMGRMGLANLYPFAFSNPTSYLDPYGDYGFWDAVSDIASVAVTAAVAVGVTAMTGNPFAGIGAAVGGAAAYAAGGNPLDVALAAMGGAVVGAVVGPMAASLIQEGAGLLAAGYESGGLVSGVGVYAAGRVVQGAIVAGVAAGGVVAGGQTIAHGDPVGGVAKMAMGMASAVQIAQIYPFPRTQSRPPQMAPRPQPPPQTGGPVPQTQTRPPDGGSLRLIRYTGSDGVPRDMVVVRIPGTQERQPFYRSSGNNSGMPGRWLPFDGLGGNPRMPDDWLNKTRFTSGGGFPQGHPLHRFGSVANMWISNALEALGLPMGQDVTDMARANELLRTMPPTDPSPPGW